MAETNEQRLRRQLAEVREAPGRAGLPREPDTQLSQSGTPSRAATAADPPEPTVAISSQQRDDDDLVPLTLDAVKTVLDRMEAHYFVDGDDAIGGIWEIGYFYFFLLREEDVLLFQVYAQWERILPPDLYFQAAILANEWNAEHSWPKAYARLLDEEETGIHGELTFDFGPSVTLDQLDRAINAGIAGSLAFFQEAQITFPEATQMEFD